MSEMDDGTPRGGHPNRDLIDGLREVADWLTAHPELARAHYAQISFGYYLVGSEARERLTDLAEALGGRARERWDYSREVVIDGKFGPVMVSASAPKSALLPKPAPEPEPEPIIARPMVEEPA